MKVNKENGEKNDGWKYFQWWAGGVEVGVFDQSVGKSHYTQITQEFLFSHAPYSSVQVWLAAGIEGSKHGQSKLDIRVGGVAKKHTLEYNTCVNYILVLRL